MNPSEIPPAPVPVPKAQRRLAWWVLAVLLVLISPIAIVGVGVASMFRLSGEAATLRREMMAASDARWNTTVQVSVGWGTLTAARTILRFVDMDHREEARLALAAVRGASVGVYQRAGRAGKASNENYAGELDRKMRARGWSRLVGVMQQDETVLIYASDEMDSGDRIELCVAVLDGEDMVVVSTEVDAAKVMELAEKQMPKGRFREQLAKL